MEKSADAFRTISEVAEDLSLPQHVLRFWETRFPQIRPLKRAGGRRYYRPMDVVLLRMIRQLLYDQGYTIKGVQRLLKEQGAKGVREGTSSPPLDLGAPGFVHVHGTLETDTIAVDDDEPDMDAVERDLPDSLLAALDTLPVDARAMLDLDGLRGALATIEECERILRALRG